MRRERHGRGPVHYSWEIDGGVFELYPGRQGSPETASLRLGFTIPNAEVALDSLRSRGFDFAVRHVERSHSPSVWVTHDPDGNTIELQERAPRCGRLRSRAG